MMKVAVAVFAMVAMIQFMAMPGEAAMSCAQVDASLASCVPFLTAGGTPSAPCCDGVKNIKNNTPTTADRRAACNCVKIAAGMVPNIKEDAAASLPEKCGVSLNIPISKTTNCDNIN